MAKQGSSVDKELKAIGAILAALDTLDGDSIQRVLDYVFGRLSLSSHTRNVPAVTAVPTSQSSVDSSPNRQASIRDLKDEKQPESSNQMAALVAYYLSEVAPDADHKESINTSDLEKYFKQAGFRLPKRMPQVLPNAAAAGYLDSAGSGLYKLNPVGYNLVVHGLPRAHASSEKSSKRSARRKKSKKKS
ncbi:MAG TPA: hypothetical protein VGW39_03210 [Chthoniobacterales bacterium]|nr:hypothetical protein [Chthoniobacterales bacterium]